MAVPYLLRGANSLVRSWLGLSPAHPDWWTKTAALRLLVTDPAIPDARAFLESLYENFEDRWRTRSRSLRPGSNWQWRRQLTIDPENESAEVQLERWIVSAHGDEWANMIPTASGVFDNGGARASIDLANRAGRKVTFYELKWGSDTPLYAALELTAYALMWLQARCRADEMGYTCEGKLRDALDAQDTEWVVLAPHDYYRRYSVSSLEQSLSAAISKLFSKLLPNVSATFVFEQLSINALEFPKETIQRIVRDRSRVCTVQ